jgi:hypothetical protein
MSKNFKSLVLGIVSGAVLVPLSACDTERIDRLERPQVALDSTALVEGDPGTLFVPEAGPGAQPPESAGSISLLHELALPAG